MPLWAVVYCLVWFQLLWFFVWWSWTSQFLWGSTAWSIHWGFRWHLYRLWRHRFAMNDRAWQTCAAVGGSKNRYWVLLLFVSAWSEGLLWSKLFSIVRSDGMHPGFPFFFRRNPLDKVFRVASYTSWAVLLFRGSILTIPVALQLIVSSTPFIPKVPGTPFQRNPSDWRIPLERIC